MAEVHLLVRSQRKKREVSRGSLKLYRLLLVAAMAQVGLKAFHMKYPGKCKGTQTCNVNVFFLNACHQQTKSERVNSIKYLSEGQTLNA